MTPTRKAIVTSGMTHRTNYLNMVRRYLPENYQAQHVGTDIVITGQDVAGWTLDGYVIPRLASGGVYAKEVQA